MIHASHLLWIIPLVSCITVAGMSVFMINALKPNMENYPENKIYKSNDSDKVESEQIDD